MYHTDAILGLQKDTSLRKPKIDYERLEELESAGLQVDRLEVVIFAVGFQAEEYSESDKKAIAHLRAAPCTPCLRIGQHCTQTNGESWKCKDCLLFARSGCEWQIDTGNLKIFCPFALTDFNLGVSVAPRREPAHL